MLFHVIVEFISGIDSWNMIHGVNVYQYDFQSFNQYHDGKLHWYELDRFCLPQKMCNVNCVLAESSASISKWQTNSMVPDISQSVLHWWKTVWPSFELDWWVYDSSSLWPDSKSIYWKPRVVIIPSLLSLVALQIVIILLWKPRVAMMPTLSSPAAP